MNRWGALRRRILTPSASAVRLDVRGFHVKSPEARDLLETVGTYFLRGYGIAAGSATVAEAERELGDLPVTFRGFACEGAGMGFAVRDGLPGGRGGRSARYLSGLGYDHIYMAYIGIGWAMARLPRMRWNVIRVSDPLLHWLVLDGYGFHQAYFRTDRYVRAQYQRDAFPWPDAEAHPYANRAIDQGIGRALWFVGGTDVGVVRSLIEAFPAERRGDLYSGAGLAATYAGGSTEDELVSLRDGAGAFGPQVAQGSAFAAGARVRAGLVVPHNDLATQVFCGMTTADAAKVTDEALVGLAADGDIPAYEVWRQRIAARFETLSNA